VKNQYFGEVRDIFMYDLVLNLLTKADLESFIWIPMLTDPASTLGGDRMHHWGAIAGRENEELCECLKEFSQEDKRDIHEVTKVFDLSMFSGYQFKLFDMPFDGIHRSEYFNNIPIDQLHRSIIVVDPDHGIWDPGSDLHKEKYIKLEEICHIFHRMDSTSIMIVFQYVPIINGTTYMLHQAEKLREVVLEGRHMVWVSEPNEAFFVLSKEEDMHSKIYEALWCYSFCYNLQFGEV
jgi:hypothetical protein